MRGDERLREIRRRVEATSSPNDAKLYLVEAVRSGRWLVTRDRYHDSVQRRLGTLRFLGYLGWREAIDLLRALPWEGEVTPSAFSILGPDVAGQIEPVVLEAAAAASCMAASHLLPPELDTQEALRVYGERIEAERRWRERYREAGVPLGADEEGSKLYEAWQRLSSRCFSMSVMFRSERGMPRMLERSTGWFASTEAREAWAELLTAVHETNRPERCAEVIFRATYALAWEFEPDVPEDQRPAVFSAEWREIPESHWLRAPRFRRSATDRYGARPSSGPVRAATRRIKRAALGPALVAACTLVVV